MIGMLDMDTSFGRESRSVTLTFSVLVLIGCVAFLQWALWACGKHWSGRLSADDE
ncbi:MAG: hypothetical protein ABI870_02655 [Rhodanobacter sp.]